MATLVCRVGELTGYRVDVQWFELQRDQCFYDFEIPYSAKNIHSLQNRSCSVVIRKSNQNYSGLHVDCACFKVVL